MIPQKSAGTCGFNFFKTPGCSNCYLPGNGNKANTAILFPLISGTSSNAGKCKAACARVTFLFHYYMDVSINTVELINRFFS
jgi:hypothetical protein